MADDIERWSEELARDPASRVFIPLADALRRRGQLDLAVRVATRGLARRPYDGDAHDLLARIYADRGDAQRAMDEWSIALQCAPAHAGALKGMGFACYQAGRTADAERYLIEAAAADPEDVSIRAALVRVRQLGAQLRASQPEQPAHSNGDHPIRDVDAGSGPAGPPLSISDIPDPTLSVGGDSSSPAPAARRGTSRIDPRLAFVGVIEPGEQAALLVDGDGLVLAGSYVVAEGRDVAQEVGAALSGVSDEARRAMRHLGLGAWSSLVFEAEAATVGMAPVSSNPGAGDTGDAGDAVAYVAAGPTVPLGLVRRVLARIAVRAQEWLAGQSAGGGR